MKPTIVILTGPTCAGKSTLESMLKMNGFTALKSVTTRLPRDGEINGITYDFVTLNQFLKMEINNELIESLEFAGQRYGLTASEALAAAQIGKPIVIVVEPHGRNQIVKYAKTNGWDAITVFVDNPSEVIAKRFLERVIADVHRQYAGKYFSNDICDSYSKRLATILSTEAGWRAEAHSGLFKYDIVLTSFGETNSGEVVDKICNYVKTLSVLREVA